MQHLVSLNFLARVHCSHFGFILSTPVCTATFESVQHRRSQWNAIQEVDDSVIAGIDEFGVGREEVAIGRH